MKARITIQVGDLYGRLTVVEQQGQRALCSCSCGSPQKLVSIYRLRNGDTKSCGCLQKESASATGQGNATHQASSTAIYNIWRGMLGRCYRPTRKDYPRYGGRGIYVCDEWRASFDSFARDMGERPSSLHSLDRYPDNDGPYAPHNCRWATPSEQGLNTRQTKYVEFDGKRVRAQDLSQRLGLKHDTVMSRLRKGWPVSEAFGINASQGDPLQLKVVDMPRKDAA